MSTAQDHVYIIAGPGREKLPPATNVLGNATGLVWGEVSSKDLVGAPRGSAGDVTLLYLSQDQYRRAVAKLSPPQIEEAVQKRRNAKEDALSAMIDEVGGIFGRLGAVADGLAQNTVDAKQAATWGRVASAALAAYESSYETGRVIQCDKEHVAMVIQWRAALLTIERHLAASAKLPAGVKAAADAAIAAHDTTFGELAQVAKELGEPAYTRAPARDVQVHAVFVPRDHPLLAMRVASGDLRVLDWNGGWIAPLSAAEASGVVQSQGVIMYWSASQFTLARNQLTKAQVERDLRERLRAGGPTVEESLAVVISMRLSLVAHLNGIIEHSPGKLGESGIALAENARLRELRLLPPFIAAEKGDEQAAAPGQMPAAAERLDAHVAVLRQFCEAAQDVDSIQWLTGADVALRRIHQLLREAGL